MTDSILKLGSEPPPETTRTQEPPTAQAVVLTGIRISFGTMVGIATKWALASLVVAIILGGVGTLLWVLIMTLIGGA